MSMSEVDFGKWDRGCFLSAAAGVVMWRIFISQHTLSLLVAAEHH